MNSTPPNPAAANPAAADLAASGLTVSNLTIEVGGRVVIDDVSFHIDGGERFGLIGESGSGKSLTALALLGLLPDGARVTGSIRLGDVEIVGLSERELARIRGRRLGIVFQEPRTALNPIRTVGRQIMTPIRRHTDASKHDARRRAIELATLVRLPEPDRIVDRYPHQLSGGQRQRVAIAIALAADPEVLIADEPTTALDVTIQAEILDLFARIQRERGMSLLFITHDLAVLQRTVDRASVLAEGRVVEEASIETLLHDPASPVTRALLEAARATTWTAGATTDHDDDRATDEGAL
ncbi:ABC transporter ATP-binding protein [Okibacterium fritillariae]|uniref:Peptide/nickel transport system ATP-binding protein n=1 Tax=Okibacterium fritillariae TaxID=123320 RepID=A0A1T5KJQ1_9MICO|nr:ABC transporter ATP-binding protein [Okibacterium fritillariae]SKC63548.1 peptide/nickel transport system ATP-binding protein [Okibacterium fritillariae]